jgi:hypothetical protein
MFYGGLQAVEYRSVQTHHIKPFIYSAVMRHRECISRKSEIMQAGRDIRLAGIDRAEIPLLGQSALPRPDQWRHTPAANPDQQGDYYRTFL